MKILLHTCCAPCLIYPLSLLKDRGYEVLPFFYNPNVHPYREYSQRYLAALDYCREQGVELACGPYEMERFFYEVARVFAPAFGGAPEGETAAPHRCSLCFGIRLSRAAAEARARGIGEFTTTLLVSPYQDRGLVREAGHKAALEHGVLFLFEDMSDGYRRSMDLSREKGIYRQSYCGCVFSEKERYQKGDPPRR